MSMTTVPRWTLADRLAKARHHCGYTQGELADRLGISRNSVSNYESGTTVPRRLVLRAWAEECAVPVEWLESGTIPQGSVSTGWMHLSCPYPQGLAA